MVATYKETPVSAAEQEAIDAEQAVTDLENKVVEGDTSITPSAIGKAKDAARFARLKVQAALRQREKDAEDARAEAVKQFRAEYEEFATIDLDPLRDAYEDAVIALANLTDLVTTRLQDQDEVLGRAPGLGVSIGPKSSSPEEQARWASIAVPESRSQFNRRAGLVIDLALREAEHGYPTDGTQVVRAHALHSDARRADMETIGRASSADRPRVAAELLTRFRQSVE